MFNGMIALYPKASASSVIELTGPLCPPPYTDSDLNKSMVKIVVDSSIEVQGLSQSQLKLVRYRVAARLLEDSQDIQNLQKAQYMDRKALELQHQMRAYHVDEGFTSSIGTMKGSS